MNLGASIRMSIFPYILPNTISIKIDDVPYTIYNIFLAKYLDN